MRASFDGLVLAALILQGLVPLALLALVALGRPGDRLRFALDVLLAGLYLTAVGLAGLWLALPRGLVGIEALLLGAATAAGVARCRNASGFRWRGARPARPGAGRLRSRRVPWLRGAAVLLVALVVGRAVSGRRAPSGEAVELELPLAGGPYRVAAGGSNTLLNPHLATLEKERGRPYRGQSRGVDLVGVGAWGSRTSVRLAAPLEDHAIFGVPVRAPCPGTVVFAADGAPDRLARGREPETLEGNHVILECEGRWVVLAHLLRGSVAVAAGDPVDTGHFLGRVGNSGRSDEPHLHVHVQTPGDEAARLGGTPLPLSFDGRAPVRNDRVHGSSLPTNRGPRPVAPPTAPDGYEP